MAEAVVLVGTKKGLWIGRSDEPRQDWEWSEPHLLMQGIYGAGIDSEAIQPRMFVGGTSEHWGPGVYRLMIWADLDRDSGAAVRFPEDLGSSVERVWQIQPAGPDEPGVIYAGTQPSALVPIRGRRRVVQPDPVTLGPPASRALGCWFRWPGHPFGASRPEGSGHVTVAMSTGGVYRTYDRGQTWNPANAGIKVQFMPDPFPEYGQCVHKIALHPDKPERMFAQNHHGVYRSDDGGDSWTSIADGLPADFGFPIVVHPRSRIRCSSSRWWLMASASRPRVRPGSGGPTTPARPGALGIGAPRPLLRAVLRDAMAADNADQVGLYLGARDGSVFVSTDDGECWRQITAHLPDVLSVRAAVI